MTTGNKRLPSDEKPWLKYITTNGTTEEPPKESIYGLFYERNQGHLEKDALVYLGSRITYAEVFRHIQDIANSFTAMGVKPGDIIAIFSSNTPETVYAMYALNYIGAVPDFEYATISEKGAVQAIKKCNAKYAMVLDVLLPGLSAICDIPELKGVIAIPVAESLSAVKKTLFKLFKNKKKKMYPKEISYKDFIARGKGTTAEEYTFKEEEMAVIVHSGGTTGKPKSVMLSNENVNYISWAVQHNFEYMDPTTDSGMCFIPMFHAFGLCLGLIAALSYGAKMILTPEFDQPTLNAAFKKYKPNHLMAGGSHVSAMLNDPELDKMDWSFLKTFVYGGSGLTTTMESEMDEFLRAHNSTARPNCGYGMSEMASGICVERNSYYGKVGSTGIPFAASNVRILDTETGEDLGYNERGELCFCGPGIMLGYYGDEEETANALFTDENGVKWIHTGDMGYVDEDGFVFITGRLKRIFSTRNAPGGTMFKIFPDYTTNIIEEVEGVEKCEVTCIPHEQFQNIAVAFVVLHEPSQKEQVEKAIWDYLKEELAVHLLPKAVCFMDAIPLTKIGKPDWVELEKLAIVATENI